MSATVPESPSTIPPAERVLIVSIAWYRRFCTTWKERKRKRSQRYAMIVDDGVVKALNVEEPGAFEVSSAEYTLQQL